ncbi:MAG: tripartite tricarboxylate transporter TctB family protein [Nocardioidaceae bacterium]
MNAASTSNLRERVPRALRLGTPVYFLGAVFLVFAVYTELAFGLEWSTEAGRIGPGFFPRIIGLLGIVTTLIALYRELRLRASGDRPVDSDEAAEDAGTHYPRAVLYLMLAAAMLAYWFLLLGAVLSGALFLGVVLWFLDPGHRVRALVLGVAMPVGMYLLFQTALNAGLPDGILPMP